jgi:hypothetical protein
MIHNAQLFDEQIFSERLASAISAIGTFRTQRDVRAASVMRSKADIMTLSAAEIAIGLGGHLSRLRNSSIRRLR